MLRNTQIFIKIAIAQDALKLPPPTQTPTPIDTHKHTHTHTPTLRPSKVNVLQHEVCYILVIGKLYLSYRI